jgi:hypothetical protein
MSLHERLDDVIKVSHEAPFSPTAFFHEAYDKGMHAVSDHSTEIVAGSVGLAVIGAAALYMNRRAATAALVRDLVGAEAGEAAVPVWGKPPFELSPVERPMPSVDTRRQLLDSLRIVNSGSASPVKGFGSGTVEGTVTVPPGSKSRIVAGHADGLPSDPIARFGSSKSDLFDKDSRKPPVFSDQGRIFINNQVMGIRTLSEGRLPITSLTRAIASQEHVLSVQPWMRTETVSGAAKYLESRAATQLSQGVSVGAKNDWYWERAKELSPSQVNTVTALTHSFGADICSDFRLVDRLASLTERGGNTADYVKTLDALKGALEDRSSMAAMK